MWFSSESLLWGTGGVYEATKHGDPVKGVMRVVGEPVGECSQCHYQHASVEGVSTGGPFDYLLFAPNDNSLCSTCHTMAKSSDSSFQGGFSYESSSHYLSSSMVWRGPQPPPRSSSDRGKCVNCHNPHGLADGQGLIPALSFSREESLCLACHGSGGVAEKDIERELTKSYRHPVMDYGGRHQADEAGSASKYSSTNRHAECIDCHNPHLAKAEGFPPSPPSASNRLVGVGRVKVFNSSAGAIPGYSYLSASNSTSVAEYEICFKCHSSWTTLPSGKEDIARSFNYNNRSYHPVEKEGQNTTIKGGAFVNDWSASSLMFCTDCHSSDNSNIRGPHGSRYTYILKKQYPPSTTKRTMSSDELCFDCHRYETYGMRGAVENSYSRWNPPASSQGHSFHVEKERLPCFTCHESHGSARHEHLIATGRSPGLREYVENSQGGMCHPSCHKPETYTINYPR